MAIKRNIKKSNIILGKNIERIRIAKNMTRMQLGRKVNQVEQQIIKYESGTDLIALPMLEKMGSALDEPIAKKIIRKICFVRKLEVDKKIDLTDELIDLYNQALPEDILE